MGVVQLSQGYGATTRTQFTIYRKSPGVPGTQFLNIGRLKGCVDIEATQWF